jgi:hypothetical protein
MMGHLNECRRQITPVMAKHSLFRLRFNVPVSRTLCSPSSILPRRSGYFPEPGNFQGPVDGEG